MLGAPMVQRLKARNPAALHLPSPRSVWFAVALLLWCLPALLGHAAQTASSRQDLLRLVRLPRIDFSIGVTFNRSDRLAWQHEQPDPDEIAAVRASLRGEPGDAERLLKLAALLRESGESAAAVAACSNAVARFRPRVAQRPDDGLLLARFGEALSGAGETQEAEAVLRRATRTTPKEPECWVGLGRFLSGLVISDLLPENRQTNGRPDFSLMELMFSKYKPTGAQFDKAERREAEAIECFNRAAGLTPNDASILEYRAACRANLSVLRVIKENATKPEPDLMAVPFAFMAVDSVPDLRRATELAPDDARLLGTVALFEVFSTVFQRKGNTLPQLPDLARIWDSLPDDTAKSVRTKLDRLTELAQSPSPIKAAEAAESLGLLKMMIAGDPRSAEVNLRRAVALNPKRDHAWDALALTLAMQSRPDDLLAVCEARLKVRATARNHFFVSKAYEKLNRWDRVLEHARTAVKFDPASFLARSSLAVALLHRGSEADVREAAENLNRATGSITQASDEQKMHLKFTAGAALALGGEAAEARKLFTALLAADKDNEDAKAALGIVGKW